MHGIQHAIHATWVMDFARGMFMFSVSLSASTTTKRVMQPCKPEMSIVQLGKKVHPSSILHCHRLVRICMIQNSEKNRPVLRGMEVFTYLRHMKDTISSLVIEAVTIQVTESMQPTVQTQKRGSQHALIVEAFRR